MRRNLRGIALFLSLMAGCGMPRDVEGTLTRVRGGVLRVGVLHAPPWASAQAASPAGIEPELVAGLARRLDARIAWVSGSPGELMRAVEQGELDLVVGGLAASSPWAPQLGTTRPFYEDTLVLALPASMPFRRGMRVAVPHAGAGAAGVRRAGGVPVPVPDPAGAPDAAAVHRWALGPDRRAERVLERTPRVWMVPAGENAWLSEVERFLDAEAAAVPGLLREGPP